MREARAWQAAIMALENELLERREQHSNDKAQIWDKIGQQRRDLAAVQTSLSRAMVLETELTTALGAALERQHARPKEEGDRADEHGVRSGGATGATKFCCSGEATVEPGGCVGSEVGSSERGCLGAELGEEQLLQAVRAAVAVTTSRSAAAARPDQRGVSTRWQIGRARVCAPEAPMEPDVPVANDFALTPGA